MSKKASKPFDLEDILNRIANGEQLRRIAADYGKSYNYLSEWLYQDPVRYERYALARERRADMFAEDVLEMAETALRDPASANGIRVAIDAKKWLAAKFYPKMYGDRQQLDVNAKVEMTEEQVEARLAAKLSALLGK